MTDKYPGFFTTIFGGRKVKEPEPVKTKKELEPSRIDIKLKKKKRFRRPKRKSVIEKGSSPDLDAEVE